MDKPKDEHDDNDEGFVTPVGSRKTSDDYRKELAKLESEKEKLIKELESKKAENLRNEIDVLRDMENSKREDFEYIEKEYEEQKKKIENLGLGKKELETRIQDLKNEHKKQTEEMRRGYDTATKEMDEGIKGMQEAYEKKIRELINEAKKSLGGTKTKGFTNKGIE